MRHLPFSRPILALLACLCAAGALHAGQITLSLDTTASVTGNQVKVDFTITNRGTDAASAVSIEGDLNGVVRRLPLADELTPGASAKGNVEFTAPPEFRGSYPIFTRIRYQDAGGSKFSTAGLAAVRTAGAPAGVVQMTTTRGTDADWGRVTVNLTATDPAVTSARVTCHCPEDLRVRPESVNVKFIEGKATAQFRIHNRSGQPDSRYAVFFAAEYEREGVHDFAQANVQVPIQTVPRNRWITAVWICGALALIGALLALRRGVREWLRRRFEGRLIPILFNLAALIAVEAFIFSQVGSSHLFTETITTGGDTASHYYTVDYLRHVLLPEGRISSWTPGNYAGFPIMQFYFPLPFLLMCGLDAFMPLQVAFKLMTLAGTFLLPIAAFVMLRQLKTPFPGPALAAAATVPFLFNSANSMWGGNLLSTFAGEFSYSFSMALSLIFLGCLYRGCLERRWVVLNAALVFLVGFSHGYTLLFAEAMSVFLVLTPRDFVQRVVYLGKVYALGFFFLAFWLVPLLAFSKQTTPYHTIWTIHSIREVVPGLLEPLVWTGLAGAVCLLVGSIFTWRPSGARAAHALAYLLFGMAVAGAMFVAAPKLGVVDIRYVPYAQLFAGLIAALTLGWTGLLLHRIGLSWVPAVVGASAVLAWTSIQPGPASGWARWNYSGFEAKPAWPQFEQINEELRGTFQDPRVVFEHSSSHNDFGSTRAFESLPLFAGRATLEGLYMQASTSAPFVFYIQSLVSQEKSCPFPQYTYANMDYARALPRLEMFNVGNLILRSTSAKSAIRAAEGYTLDKTIRKYELWSVPGAHRYVVPLRNEPVLGDTEDWKRASHEWFLRDETLDQHLVFLRNPSETDRKRFAVTKSSPDDLPIDTAACVVEEKIGNREIRIRTNWIDKPLLVKMSYHPNWHVEGARGIYLVSPSFMLIYPEQEEIRMWYGWGPWDWLGAVLSVLGIGILLLNLPLWKGRRTAWSALAPRLGVPPSLVPRIPWDPSSRARWTILGVFGIGGAAFVAVACYHIYVGEPHRLFNTSVKLKDAKRFEEARAGFRSVMEQAPTADIGADSAYYIAITWYLENRNEEAIAAFDELIRRYPHNLRVPEAQYHVGLCRFRQGDEAGGIEQMRMVIERFPGSPWANYATDRLREHRAPEKIPDNETVQQKMGRAIKAFNTDRLEDAGRLCREIVAEYPDFDGAPQALAIVALCHYKQGDNPRTIQYYLMLIERYPGSPLAPEAWYHIGLCHELMRRPEPARGAWQKAAELYPDSEYGKLAREKLNQHAQ